MKNDQIFYVGQKAFIERDGEVLILLLPNGMLDFPGGKIQEGEIDFDTALKREVMEETGLEIEIESPFYRWSFEFHAQHPKAGEKVFLVGFRCKHISGEVKLSNEHSKYRWVNKDNFAEYNDESEHYKALEAYFLS